VSKIVYKNHFLLSDDTESVLRGKKQGVSFFNVASSHPEKFDGMEGVTVFKRVNKPEDACFGALALMDLTDDKIVDAVSEAVLGNGAKLIAAAGYSLDETGLIDVKFHLSPVQYLHKLGLLEKCRRRLSGPRRRGPYGSMRDKPYPLPDVLDGIRIRNTPFQGLL